MKICKVEGCESKYHARGYCNKHYNQIKNHNRLFKRTRFDPNEIIIKGEIAEVVLYNKDCREIERAIIDTEDVGKVKNYKWHLSNDGYVQTRIGGRLVRIQNIVMCSEKGVFDHKDRKTLNNYKSNLRGCTRSENGMNRPKQKNNTSGYKGVSKNGKNWKAQIKTKKSIHLGTFKRKTDAAGAYNQAAIEHFGKFACLNEV